MADDSPRVLVAGATGQVGGIVTRKLLAAGVPVRALGRHREKLVALADAGAEVIAVDLLDRTAVARACEGVGQVFSTVNNVMGRGASSPNRVDLAAYESLCSGATDAGVRRLVYLSGRGMSADDPVDFFRVKHAIEARIRQGRVPFVVLQAGAFMETWVGMLSDGMRKKGVAVLFGDGRMISNFIAVEDVAEFAVRILAREEIVNETIEVGGPSNISFDALVSLLETQMGMHVKRRRVPRAVLWLGGLALKPFNEVAARLMRLGYFTATRDLRLLDWRVAADRFGVSPMRIEEFVSQAGLA
ncbi:MAG: NmrA family NAD(P)-binding protein [Cytophagaceae bacterium]|nr:NmrA family NAD(P)-binding protein [Gemmatimonadaceae bacterium]